MGSMGNVNGIAHRCGASSKLILPSVQKNKTYPIIEWTVIIDCTNIFRTYRVNEMSIGSRTDSASFKLILPGVQKNKTYPIIEWSM